MRMLMSTWMITGSATEDGQPIYMQNDSSWTGIFSKGFIIENAEEREHMLCIAQQNEKVVCDPYIIEVNIVDGKVHPNSLREQIRATGPTIALPIQRT